jgi:hypothetical protein
MNSHAIVGIVRERPSGKPLEGLRVRAYDRDENTNDFVGEATTRQRQLRRPLRAACRSAGYRKANRSTRS